VTALCTVSILSLTVKTKPKTRRSAHHPKGGRRTPLTFKTTARAVVLGRDAVVVVAVEPVVKSMGMVHHIMRDAVALSVSHGLTIYDPIGVLRLRHMPQGGMI